MSNGSLNKVFLNVLMSYYLDVFIIPVVKLYLIFVLGQTDQNFTWLVKETLMNSKSTTEFEPQWGQKNLTVITG